VARDIAEVQAEIDDWMSDFEGARKKLRALVEEKREILVAAKEALEERIADIERIP
jgi:hypothetical protein